MSPTTGSADPVILESAPLRSGASGSGASGSRASGSEPAIVLEGVSKAYGHSGAATTALDGVWLEVARGELVCLVGASGCGKSTLLNLVAGLDQPTAGTLSRPGGDAALMFQDAALFPWLTLGRNVELALRLRGVPRSARAARVAELIHLVRLDGFEDRRPHELSGGMRQRGALARALAQERPILLMDEPFGALDAITRDLLHDELERIWSATDLTVLFVTHNVSEAVRLADRVVVLSSRPGRVAATYSIPVERPRRADDPAVAELTVAITSRLREEVRHHAR